MHRRSDAILGEIYGLLESGSRVLGLRLCLHSFIPEFLLSREWNWHHTPCCYWAKTKQPSGHPTCIEFCNLSTYKEMETLPGGRIQTCPYGLTEIVAPIFSDQAYTGMLYAGQCWMKRGAPPPGVAAVRPSRRWLNDRRETVCALAARFGKLMRGAESYVPETRRETILSWMNERLEKPVGVDELAERLCVSPAHAGRLVKKLFGLSFPEFARGMKMRDACRYLVSGDLPIGEVARFVGYPDQNHFSRVFKAHFGLSPRAYRRSRAHLA